MPRPALALTGVVVLSRTLPVPSVFPPLLSLPQPRTEPSSSFSGAPSKGERSGTVESDAMPEWRGRWRL